MTIIEYNVLSSRGLIGQAQCNELGKDGWILSTIFRDQAILYYYFFRIEEVEDTQESTVTRMDNEVSRLDNETPSSLIH
jgi:hypothetical protein